VVAASVMARCKAVQTRSAGMASALAQPTILREYKSSTAARYSHYFSAAELRNEYAQKTTPRPTAENGIHQANLCLSGQPESHPRPLTPLSMHRPTAKALML